MNRTPIIVGIVLLAVFGFLLLHNPISLTKGGDELAIHSGESRLEGSLPPMQDHILKALVKGSIYETGEFVSVFGTCLNETDGGFPGSYATMNSWYPNGTVFFQNVTMQELQVGYFLYTGNMSAVQGTYLTEMTCRLNDSDMVAKSFGEWQNPMWVKKISDLNVSNINYTDQLNNISSQISNMSLQIGNLSIDINNSFNITWTKIDQINVSINNTFNNLSQQITYVGQIANASVDRNDSYLAYLLYQIINNTGVPQNFSLAVSTNFTPNPPQYLKPLMFQSRVLNEFGMQVGEPTVTCLITTNNFPGTNSQPMNWNNNKGLFEWTETVRVLQPITFNVSCAYN